MQCKTALIKKTQNFITSHLLRISYMSVQPMVLYDILCDFKIKSIFIVTFYTYTNWLICS